jgi:hypothetical protein
VPLIREARAQRTIGQNAINRATLYSEPCAMCAFCIRGAWVRRVVDALESLLMRGLSKWNIRRDASISDSLPRSFDAVPEVESGILAAEAQQAWWNWNPYIGNDQAATPAGGAERSARADPPQAGAWPLAVAARANRADAERAFPAQTSDNE